MMLGMTDAELIDSHGGSTKLAQKMGLTGKWSIQRVQNWKRRGIPAAIKLKYPALFLGQEIRGSDLADPASGPDHA